MISSVKSTPVRTPFEDHSVNTESTGVYERCLSHWNSISKNRQEMLIQQMQSYMNVRIAAATDNNPHFLCSDGMGEDTTDLAGIFD